MEIKINFREKDPRMVEIKKLLSGNYNLPRAMTSLAHIYSGDEKCHWKRDGNTEAMRLPLISKRGNVTIAGPCEIYPTRFIETREGEIPDDRHNQHQLYLSKQGVFFQKVYGLALSPGNRPEIRYNSMVFFDSINFEFDNLGNIKTEHSLIDPDQVYAQVIKNFWEFQNTENILVKIDERNPLFIIPSNDHLAEIARRTLEGRLN